jgi:hypothetical protein
MGGVLERRSPIVFIQRTVCEWIGQKRDAQNLGCK